MSRTTYGYVRVSTKHQKEDRQLAAMREFGVEEKNIVVEKQSGREFDRPKYQKLVKKLKPGDTLVIKSIDRLGRNYTEILEQWRIIGHDKDVAIVVLDMPLLNTREDKELVWKLVTDLVLQIVSYVAQAERESILQRQREGIAAAKKRGVRFGRPRLDMPPDFEESAVLWREGSISAREAAGRLGISLSTFVRRVREAERQSAAAHPDPAPASAGSRGEAARERPEASAAQAEADPSDLPALFPQDKHRKERRMRKREDARVPQSG